MSKELITNSFALISIYLVFTDFSLISDSHGLVTTSPVQSIIPPNS